MVNIHIYQTDFLHESRILRITKTIQNGNYFDKIIIFSTHSKNLKLKEKIDENRTLIRVKTIMKPDGLKLFRYFFLIEWALRIVIKSFYYDIKLINPHSVPALFVAYFLRLIHRSKIFYDTHEIETEQYPTNSSTKLISKFIEKKIIDKCELVITTSDGFTDWYSKNYGLKNIITVKNYPLQKFLNLQKINYMRNYCECLQEDILFIYQGIISQDRGVGLLIKIFQNLPKNKKIVFMGYGESVEQVIKHSKISSNIYYHDPVKPSEVQSYISSCDVGFCLIPNLHLSYYHTLPNKMLECMSVKVPVIVSDHPDMRKNIEEFDTGWDVKMEYEKIFSLVLNIKKNEIDSKKINCLKWAQKNTWESQEKILYKSYSSILQ